MSKRNQHTCSLDPDSNTAENSTWQQPSNSAKIKTPRKNKKRNEKAADGKKAWNGNSSLNVRGNRSPKKSRRKAIADAHLQTTIQNVNRLIGDLQDEKDVSTMKKDETNQALIIEMIFDLRKEVHILANELNSSMEASKLPKEKSLSEGFALMFEAANVNTQHWELGEIQVDDDIEEIISGWNDITSVITHSLQNENGKPSPKRASLIKLQNSEAGEMFLSIVQPIASILNIQWSEDTLIVPISLFMKTHSCRKMLALLECLGVFLAGFGFNLKLEEHICRLVTVILIPILEFDLRSSFSGDRSLPISNALSVQVAVMDTIVRILRWKQCSSALLAPQIVDLDGSDDAKHLKTSSKLLASIVKIINSDDYLQLETRCWVCQACQCLKTILENMSALKGKQKTPNGVDVPGQSQIANIYKWVHKTLQCKIDGRSPKGYSLWWYSLDLLKTVVRLYPKICAQYWSLFLPQVTSYSPSRKVKGSTTVHLISIMSLQNDSSLFSDEKVMAKLCCQEILEALPLHLWSRSGYLAGRIESSLSALIRTTADHLSTDCPQIERKATYSLAVTIFMNIPFEKYTMLKEPAIEVINQMGKNYTMYGLHGGLGLEVVVQAITDCMGGQEIPNGEIIALPLPTCEWLKRPASGIFVSHIFNKMIEISSHEIIEKGYQTMIQMTLFVQIIRSATWILMGDKSRLDALVELTTLLLASEDNALKIIGADLLSAFIIGRKCATKFDGEIPLSVYAHLDTMMTIQDSKVRCSTLNTLSLLEFNTWKSLIASEQNPLQLMLQMSLEYSGDKDGKVRSEACKALGNIMTTFMRGISRQALGSPVRESLHQNIKDTIQVAASAMEDSDANVRSMALFAIGNIAFDTAKSEEWEFIKLLPMLQLCDLSYNRLSDNNEKVINNAIRTAGHLFHLANSEGCRETIHRLEETPWVRLCSLFLQTLGTKINRAIQDVIEVCNERSWKQRMNSKKQAWGACQTCTPILQFLNNLQCKGQDAVRNGILQLIYCVEYAEKTNEKITIAAVSSLNEIGKDMWLSISGIDGTRGLCLAACIKIASLTSLPPGVRQNLHAIMLTILPYLDDHDITIFHVNSIATAGSHENVEYLYGWMVENEVGPVLFQEFGKSLCNPSLCYDVSIIQKFHSRAIYEARKRRRSVGNNHEMLESEEDSDEDEL